LEFAPHLGICGGAVALDDVDVGEEGKTSMHAAAPHCQASHVIRLLNSNYEISFTVPELSKST